MLIVVIKENTIYFSFNDETYISHLTKSSPTPAQVKCQCFWSNSSMCCRQIKNCKTLQDWC